MLCLQFAGICGKISFVIAISAVTGYEVGGCRLWAGNFDGAMFGLNSGEKLLGANVFARIRQRRARVRFALRRVFLALDRENLLKWSGISEKLTEALFIVPEGLTLFRKSKFAVHTALWIFQTEVDRLTEKSNSFRKVEKSWQLKR